MSDETQVLDILKETRRNLNAGKVVFGRFELERELGSGGMGVVWLAKDNDVEGRVALKFLPGLVRDPVAERDLRDEVKNARDLVHENIVNVRTLHKDESSIAVEMEFVDGPSVSRLIAESPNCWLDPEGAASIVRGLCLAIDYAWKPPRKLVHRDVKPLNLLLNSAGVAKVVDFGIAHSVSETVARLTNISAAKRVVGSLPYMSPQQLRGEIHHLNDVYSIGATIFELLTGTPPFRAKDVATLTSQINHDLPVAMTERRWQLIEEKNRNVTGNVPLPKDWEEVVAACLEKDSAKRPKDAREIAVRLGLVAENKTKLPFPAHDAAGNRAKKRRSPLILGTAAVLVAGAGLTAWMFRDRIAPKETAPSTPTAVVSQPKTAPTTESKKATVPSETETGAKAAAKEPTPAPAKQPAQNPPSAPLPAPPRKDWQLVATAPVRLAVSDSGGNVLYEGSMTAGEKRPFPVDKALLVEVREGGGLSLEIDGKPMLPPPVASNRWIMNIPAPAEAAPKLSEAPPPPPPFEAEVGPLVKSGQVNKLESDWLRAALGGAKGEEERALARQLFEKHLPLALQQWRSRTTLEFRPNPKLVASTDPAVMMRAIDLVLPPGGVTIRLIRIEPGTFRKGANNGEIGWRPSDQASTPAVIAKPFFIGKFEVTQKQFASVMKSDPSWWRNQHPMQPVEQVTWNDIKGTNGFIAQLNLALAKTFEGALEADLPTDEEWEYACRAGTTTAYNNGQDSKHIETDPGLNDIAVYNRASGPPKPVGSMSPNAWGLYDMHGNVQEWTLDRHVRGGSWQSKAAGCRSAARIQMSREAPKSNLTGFRLVLRIKDSAQGR